MRMWNPPVCANVLFSSCVHFRAQIDREKKSCVMITRKGEEVRMPGKNDASSLPFSLTLKLYVMQLSPYESVGKKICQECAWEKQKSLQSRKRSRSTIYILLGYLSPCVSNCCLIFLLCVHTRAVEHSVQSRSSSFVCSVRPQSALDWVSMRRRESTYWEHNEWGKK